MQESSDLKENPTILVKLFATLREGRGKTIDFPFKENLTPGEIITALAIPPDQVSILLVVLAMFTRGALMNASGPVFTAFAMNILPHRDRPVFSALNMMGWNIGWAIAATFSGIFRSIMGKAQILPAFNWLFAWTILMYSLSIFVTYLWLLNIKVEKKST